MIERVYIIGAGASVPYGLPTLKTVTWEVAQSLPADDRKVFLVAVRDCFRKAMNKPEDSPDFEELLNRLNPRALRYLEETGLGGPESDRRKAAELALSGLRTFLRIRCEALRHKTGPFDVLANALDNTALTVSFNWDVLLELAILRSGRTFCYLPSERARDAVVLLKPHGSINWHALLDREMLVIPNKEGNLRVVGDDLATYLCYVKHPLEPIDFTGCSETVRHVLSNVPAIVPPVASKMLSVGGAPRDGFVDAGHTRALTRTWAVIVNALAQAREVVAIGYSLPGTDAAAIEALKYFAGGSTQQKDKRVFLVEPDPTVRDRYRSVLGIDVEIVCPDFGDFDPHGI
jgi:hypothetical protein